VLSGLADGELHIAHTTNVRNRFEEVRARIDQLRQLIEADGLGAVVNELFPDEEARVRDLRAIMMAAIEETPELTIQQFLGTVSDAITKPEIPENVEEVRVMSLHKSKGLSSPVTIIAGCVEGLLPRQPGPDLNAQETLASIEEQRRLFYVGITRVKAVPPDQPGHLVLTSAREMPVATARRAGITPANANFGQAQLLPSRFLGEFDGHAPATEQG
jgi:superfamily I DNA/RNA helicase